MALAWIWGGLLSAAFAESVVDVDILVHVGHPAEALSRSAQHLAEHPHDVAMAGRHAYAAAAAGEGPELVASMKPDGSALSDVVWTVAVVHGLADADPHCEQVAEVFDHHRAGVAAWELERLRPRAAEVCGGRVPAAPRRPQGAVPDSAGGLSLSLSLAEGPVDMDWGAAVERHIVDHANEMLLFTAVFDDASRGPGLVRARVALSARAEEVVESGTTAELWAARAVRLAQDADTDAIDNRMPELATAPSWLLLGQARALGPRRSGRPDLEHALRLAVSQDTPADRLDLLKALDDDIPEDDSFRARWWAHIAHVELDLGHERRGLAALEAAWQHEPRSGFRASAFAWEAALQGRRLKPALAAIDGALADRAAYHSTRGGPSGDTTFRWEHGHEVGAWLDTRAWIRFQLGDIAGARADLDRALLLYRSPSATAHLHAGLIAAADDDPEVALFHLRQGLARVDARYDEAVFVEMGQQRVAELYAAHRWHPNGLSGWLAGASSEPNQAPPEPIVDLDAVSDALAAIPIPLALEGMPLPDFLVQVDGSPSAIQELGEWRIIDLWAPWCLPCHEQMGVLHELVRQMDADGVALSVVVVSVEESPSDSWKRSLGLLESDRWVVGWTGPPLMDTLGAPGLPTTLLVAPDGRVVRARTGWFGDLDWLREALAEEGVWP